MTYALSTTLDHRKTFRNKEYGDRPPAKGKYGAAALERAYCAKKTLWIEIRHATSTQSHTCSVEGKLNKRSAAIAVFDAG